MPDLVEIPVYDITAFGAVPDAEAPQTAAIQRALDACAQTGGVVVIPRGRFVTAGLRMYSDTEVHLAAGARLVGSGDCADYAVFPVPEGVTLYTDMEMIPAYYNRPLWPEYRRAILSAYGEHDVAVTGEADAAIDGSDCYDPHGEENFRGPHGIFFSSCTNVTLRGYTIGRTGNFMHQLDNCRNIFMQDVTCLAGHDGIHLHACERTRIERCVFHTGDDCIAGINVRNLTVRNCELNTACHLFRIGGTDITVEDCRMFGPGIFPHRLTVVRGREDVLPDEAGRHNTLAVMCYFASETHPSPVPARRILFRNCRIENVDCFLKYEYRHSLQTGTALVGLSLRDVTITGLLASSHIRAKEDEPLTVELDHVLSLGRNGQPLPLFDGSDPATTVIER